MLLLTTGVLIGALLGYAQLLMISHAAPVRRVVVVGGGAAGFFSAIQCGTVLKTLAIVDGSAQGSFAGNTEVVLLEASKEVLAKVKISGGGRCNVMHDPSKGYREIVKGYPRGMKELLGPFSAQTRMKKGLEDSTSKTDEKVGFGPLETYNWFRSRGVELKTELDGRVFPTSDKSSTIIEALKTAANEAGVRVQYKSKVFRIDTIEGSETNRFKVFYERTGEAGRASNDESDKVDSLECTNIVMATGSSRYGYNMVTSLENHIISTPLPSLFSFKLDQSVDGNKDLLELSGVCNQYTKVKLLLPSEWKTMSEKKEYIRSVNTYLTQRGPMLVTQQGLSGPAVLRLSSFAAKAMAEMGYNFQIEINFLGEVSTEEVVQLLTEQKSSNPNRLVGKFFPHITVDMAQSIANSAFASLWQTKKTESDVSNEADIDWDTYNSEAPDSQFIEELTQNSLLTRRMWLYVLQHRVGSADLSNKKWAEIDKKTIRKIAEEVTKGVYRVKGRGLYRDEFVTCGGVDLKQITFSTMESKKVPGLYFCGEILDIDGVTEMYTSYKWISNSAEGGGLEVHDVAQVFRPCAKNECNLISIFGRARQGKSFLMNCLSGERGIFKISNEKESCTQGIDISNKWLGISEFSSIDKGKMVKGNTKVGFVDAEGQGDKDVSYDANLICPILLASKCVIFNWKGDLQKDHILSTLGIMTRAAKNVGLESDNGRQKFGHLHIVFRDWQSASKHVPSTFNLLFGIEGTVEAATRDQIRHDVMESFESIRVWLFDAPSEYTSVLKTKMTFDKTSADFKAQVRELRGALSQQLVQPTMFAGQPLVGKAYDPLLRQVASALNRGEAVLPTSAYISMMKVEVDKLRRAYETDARLVMEDLLKRFDSRCSESSADDVLVHLYPTETDAKRELMKEFDKLNSRYEMEMEESLGNMTNTIAGQVMAGYPEEIGRIQKNILSQFLASYKNNFMRWLASARRQAESFIDRSMDDIIKKVSSKIMSPETVSQMLDSAIYSVAVSMIGVEMYPNIPEVADAVGILQRHFQAESSKVKAVNAKRWKDGEEVAECYLTEAIGKMKHTIKKAVSDLQVEQPTGYPQLMLERVLNNKYFELNDLLSQQLQDSYPLFYDSVLGKFKDSCAQMQVTMKVEYASCRRAALDTARGTCISQFTHQLANSNPDVSQERAVIVDEFRNLLNGMVDSCLHEVIGWLSSEASDNQNGVHGTNFAHELRDVLDSTLIDFMVEVDRNICEYVTSLKTKESEPEFMKVDSEFYETEDDEDISQATDTSINKSIVAGSKSDADPRNKAKEWAKKEFGLDETKKKRTSKKNVKATVPRKTVQQQREDAAKYAIEKFGHDSVLDSPEEKATVEDGSHHNKKRRLTPVLRPSLDGSVEISPSSMKENKSNVDSSNSKRRASTEKSSVDVLAAAREAAREAARLAEEERIAKIGSRGSAKKSKASTKK